MLNVLVAGLKLSRVPAEQYLDGVMKARNMFLKGVVPDAAVSAPEDSGESMSHSTIRFSLSLISR